MDVIIVNESPEFKNYMTEEEDKERIHNSEIYSARKKGYEQGSNKRTIEIAKNLINQKVDINIISKTTGLSIEEIENLK